MSVIQWNDHGAKQREAQIMLAVLCAETLLPIYELDRDDDRPHKAIELAKKYVQAKDNSTRAMIEAEAKRAMTEVGAVCNRYGIGSDVANVAWHAIRAVVYPMRTAQHMHYAVAFASRIVARVGAVAALLGERNRYAIDVAELAKQAVAIIEDK